MWPGQATPSNRDATANASTQPRCFHVHTLTIDAHYSFSSFFLSSNTSLAHLLAPVQSFVHLVIYSSNIQLALVNLRFAPGSENLSNHRTTVCPFSNHLGRSILGTLCDRKGNSFIHQLIHHECMCFTPPPRHVFIRSVFEVDLKKESIRTRCKHTSRFYNTIVTSPSSILYGLCPQMTAINLIK